MSEFTYGLHLPIPQRDLLASQKNQLPLFVTQLANNQKSNLTPAEKAQLRQLLASDRTNSKLLELVDKHLGSNLEKAMNEISEEQLDAIRKAG